MDFPKILGIWGLIIVLLLIFPPQSFFPPAEIHNHYTVTITTVTIATVTVTETTTITIKHNTTSQLTPSTSGYLLERKS